MMADFGMSSSIDTKIIKIEVNEGRCRVVDTKEHKQKDEEGPPEPPEGWKRCRAYLERKRRFCKQWPNDGKKYCGNHQHLETTISGSGNEGSVRKRIPCPIDPSQ
jgi:tRNA:m4X modification enzyme